MSAYDDDGPSQPQHDGGPLGSGEPDAGEPYQESRDLGASPPASPTPRRDLSKWGKGCLTVLGIQLALGVIATLSLAAEASSGGFDGLIASILLWILLPGLLVEVTVGGLVALILAVVKRRNAP